MFSVHLLPCSQNTMCSFDNPWDEGPSCTLALIARLMRSTWGPSGADMTLVGPILAPWTLLSGCICLCCPDWFRFLLSNDLMHPLTLSQWSSSGNTVAVQRAWNLDPSVHWNATGEIMLIASVLPVVFQWSSSGFPVVFQCVPIMQINTGSPLGHHWVLASASVVPVAFQCTCGSSGLPVCSNYAN